MVRRKKITPAGETAESKSMTRKEESKSVKEVQVEKAGDTAPVIRILYHGECTKLTPRGVGNIEYELGINEENDEACIRIAGNASSGAFNTKWVGVDEIREVLETVANGPFRAIVLQKLYTRQSSNNHGFLGAILKAEGVLVGLEKPSSMLKMGEWSELMEKIESLKEKGVSLTDHIAVASAKRAERKGKTLSKQQPVKKDKGK